MTLQEALSAIKTAVYGEDVRNAILGGLELCYTERLSGGYNSNDDLNNHMNGIALFSSDVANRPFNSSFIVYAGGNEEECCQVAMDPAKLYSTMIRHKENGAWTSWSSVVETATYQVRYYTYDGSRLLYTEKVSEGKNASWNGTPEKASTDQYEYIFLGWNLRPNQTEISEGALSNLRASVDVYAAYSANPRSYYVYFYNGDVLFDTQSVVYGHNATSPSRTPTKQSTPQHNYSFIGWNTNSQATEGDSSALSNVRSNRTVYAIYSASVRTYTVSFRNGSTELQSIIVPYGGTAVYSGVTPTKESSEQYDYSFVGWSTVDGATSGDDSATKNISSDRILYAAFSSSTLAYTVRFMNGARVLETLSVEYGKDASYSGSTPTKDSTAQYNYSFIGWNTNPNAVSADSNAVKNITSNRDIYAIYQATVREYTVAFMNGDVLLTTASVRYGSNATYGGSTPMRPSSAQYDYTFAGWNTKPNQSSADPDALNNITGDRTVYATYVTTTRTYIVRFIDSGNVLQTKDVPYGSDVTYTGTTPSKESTPQYIYTFIGWNSSPNQTEKDDTVLQNITSNRDIYAAYSQTLQQYRVTFYNGSSRLGTNTVNYGETAIYKGTTPTKESTEEHVYSFVGWNSLPDQDTAESGILENITGDKNVYAAFSEAPVYCTVRFYYNSTLLDTQTTPYNGNVTYGGVTPTKQSVAQYDYTFNGWNTAEDQTTGISGILNNVTRDLTLYAAFLPVVKKFTVRFLNGSTVLQTSQVAYGSDASYSGTNPTKAPSEYYTYSFVGWALQDGQTESDFSALMDITADRDIYAAFSQSTRYYTVKFYNGSTLLDTQNVTYGSNVTYGGTTPSKESSEGTFMFDGWNEDPNATSADRNALNSITADKNLYAIFSEIGLIYGIKRLANSALPEWERTDAAVGMTATASVGSTAGHSDFDNAPIYKDIKRVTMTTGDVMVQIPKFYYQRYVDENNYEIIRIAATAQEGFTIHPAFNHNDQIQDFIYIGAYVTSTLNDESFVSKSGATVMNVKDLTSMSNARSQVNSKDTSGNWWLLDISAHSALCMLYLVEFATNDSQSAIGPGCSSTSPKVTPNTTGVCDTVPNLTGRPDGTANQVSVVYRGIENLWSSFYCCLDGILTRPSSRRMLVTNDTTKYGTNSDTNYTQLSYTYPYHTTSASELIIAKMGIDTDNTAYILPNGYSSSGVSNPTTHYCDTIANVTSTMSTLYQPCFYGKYGLGNKSGIFHMHVTLGGTVTSSFSSDTTVRLMYLPLNDTN